MLAQKVKRWFSSTPEQIPIAVLHINLLPPFVEGKYAGSCSFGGVSERNRMRHRCTVGISLYRDFWGQGIGTVLMSEILSAARAAGSEQIPIAVLHINLLPPLWWAGKPPVFVERCGYTRFFTIKRKSAQLPSRYLKARGIVPVVSKPSFR